MKNNNKPACIIFDIDVVVCDSRQRHGKYIDSDALKNGEMQNYLKSLENYSHGDYEMDVVLPLGKKLFQWAIDEFQPDKIFFLTARGTNGKDQTEKWLEKYGFMSNRTALIMRPEYPKDDKGKFIVKKRHKDAEYKKEVAEKIKTIYDIKLAVDDKLSICEMYEELGLQVIHLMICEMP